MGLFSCGDARNYLKDFGYGTIALPREGIKPLLMMVKNGARLMPLGPLAGTFQPGASPLPAPLRQRSANVSGSKSQSVDLDIGISILGTVIGALSGSSLGLKAAYKSSRKVEFEFGDVMEDRIEIAELDAYLSNGKVAGTIGNFVRQALEQDEVYVIVSTLDARQISVEGKDEHNAGVGVEVPVIQQIVGGKIAVSAAGGGGSKVTYTSTETPLSFGLQVVRMIVDNGKYATLKTVKPQDGAALAAPRPTPAIVGPGLRIEL